MLLMGILCLTATNLLAQHHDHEKVQAAKIAFITNKLNLTSKQAEQFWPLYNEFEAKRKELKDFLKEGAETELTDAQAKEEIKKLLASRQQEVDLEKEYADKFMKVITPKQVHALMHSEKEFTRMLVKRLRERRKGMEF